MRLFKSKAFGRFARSQGITDDDLCEAIERAEKGLIDANLGGHVIKQRIARDGEGKSGGFRSIIFFKAGDKAIFVHGFEKSAQANISTVELREYKAAAKIILKYSDEQMNTAVASGAFVEVKKRK
jgi:hypothetical protein